MVGVYGRKRTQVRRKKVRIKKLMAFTYQGLRFKRISPGIFKSKNGVLFYDSDLLFINRTQMNNLYSKYIYGYRTV